MHHPAAEICHTRTASTTVLPAHGDQCDRASWCPAHRGGYPRSTTQCGGRLVGRKEAAFGQCSAGAALARRGECSCRCRSTVPVGVNDSTSARKVSCSGRAAQLVMWVHREAMKPACVCVVECLSGSVWRGGQCPAAIDPVSTRIGRIRTCGGAGHHSLITIRGMLEDQSSRMRVNRRGRRPQGAAMYAYEDGHRDGHMVCIE